MSHSEVCPRWTGSWVSSEGTDLEGVREGCLGMVSVERGLETRYRAKRRQWEKAKNPVMSKPSNTMIFFLLASFHLFPKQSEISRIEPCSRIPASVQAVFERTTEVHLSVNSSHRSQTHLSVIWHAGRLRGLLPSWNTLAFVLGKDKLKAKKMAFRVIGNKVRLFHSFFFFFFFVYSMKTIF